MLVMTDPLTWGAIPQVVLFVLCTLLHVAYISQRWRRGNLKAQIENHSAEGSQNHHKQFCLCHSYLFPKTTRFMSASHDFSLLDINRYHYALPCTCHYFP